MVVCCCLDNRRQRGRVRSACLAALTGSGVVRLSMAACLVASSPPRRGRRRSSAPRSPAARPRSCRSSNCCRRRRCSPSRRWRGSRCRWPRAAARSPRPRCRAALRAETRRTRIRTPWTAPVDGLVRRWRGGRDRGRDEDASVAVGRHVACHALGPVHQPGDVDCDEPEIVFQVVIDERAAEADADVERGGIHGAPRPSTNLQNPSTPS